MSYVIIGSERSPFVRVCRMLMIQHAIPFQFRVLNFVDDPADAAALSKETPINKAPVLLDGAQKIFDSRVIINYLARKHDLPPLTMDEENLLSAAYSCMDVGVMLFLMKRDGYDLSRGGSFLARNRERIPRNLEFMIPWAKTLDPSKPRDWNAASMSLFAFLHWGEVRAGVVEAARYPELTSFMERFRGAPGVKETSF